MFSFENNKFGGGLSQERTGRTRAETRAKQNVKAAFARERTATLAENESKSRNKRSILVAQIAEGHRFALLRESIGGCQF
jgi:hypothetical protein